MERDTDRAIDWDEVLDVEALDANPATVLAVDTDFRIRYVNPAWARFAAENGAPQDLAERYGAGSDLLASVPAALAGFYRGLFTRTLTLHSPDAMQPVSHEYECSSPDVYRRYAMAIYPLRNQAGLLMVHTLRIESPIETRPGFIEGAPDGEYIAADGLVRQCACCRRTRSVRQPDQWHWIRDWVSRCPAMISHTVCAVCAVAYYPGLY